MDVQSVARSAREGPPELVECFRHEGEGCPRCDGSGFRPRKHCAGCGKPAGSISQGTGAPLVKDRHTDGASTTSAACQGIRSSTPTGPLSRGWAASARPPSSLRQRRVPAAAKRATPE